MWRTRQDMVERSGQERRVEHIRSVVIIGTLLFAGTIGFYAWLYSQTRKWQILVDGSGLVLSIVCMALAYLLTRRGKLDAAGYWLLFALALPYVASELVWTKETTFNVAGGTMLLLLVGAIVLRQKWLSWIVAAGLYVATIFAINQLEPLPRLDIATHLVVLYYFDLSLTVLLALIAVLLSIRALRGGSIRTRLLVAFMLVSLLPVTVIGLGVVATGGQSNQQAVLNQLESVATLKEHAINTWLDTLQTDLAAVQVGQDTVQYALVLLQGSPDEESYQDAYEKLHRRYSQSMAQTQRFDRIFLINREGRVVLSTDATQNGTNYADSAFFQGGLEKAQSYVTREWNLLWLDSVRPITDEQGQVWGVLTGRATLFTLNQIMRTRTGLGATGETYLLDAERNVLTKLRSGVGMSRMPAKSAYATIVQERFAGSDMYDDYDGVPVVGVYHWLPAIRAVLVTEQHQAEAFREINTATAIVAGTILLTMTISAAVALFITQGIADPLSSLAETATQIASGNLEHVARVDRQDEIGTLAEVFNSMTAQLREMIDNLEQRVADRTRELERRSVYMEASSEVGRVASSILDVNVLVQQLVELIRERFSLYYVGLFLVDESGEWAVLRAGTGSAGRAMLSRGHRLKVGREGMIGWSIANAQARIALYAEEDIVRTVTAELPDTRSEAALPLRSRGRVLGALTIQHDEANAFDDDTIAVLQMMADQVAIALDNAKLFTESQAALETARRAYTELRRDAWIKLLRTQPDVGYRSRAGSVMPAEDVWRGDMERALQEKRTVQGNGTDDEGKLTLAVPIKVRDDVIGVLDTYKPTASGEWTTEEIAVLETLADQLGEALESARLYQDTQRRAARERLTSEITDKMRRATSIEDIVRTAVDELFGTMETSRAFVRLGSPQSARDDDEGIE
jgi:GAF domain-containing protein/HAMP domain-containing protein